jgi:hypothetical protein
MVSCGTLPTRLLKKQQPKWQGMAAPLVLLCFVNESQEIK